MKRVLVALAALLILPRILRAGGIGLSWTPIVQPQTLRVDAQGSGAYGASRSGHIHEGVDLLVSPGQAIRAPFAGVITRVAYPYASDLRWKGVEIAGAGAWDGYRAKIFYMEPQPGIVGQSVSPGQMIGTAQNISSKYGGGMLDHIHVELWRGSENLDPTDLLF